MGFRRRAKSPALFSQEFLIHNHADLGFCLVLCVLLALMFECEAVSWGSEEQLLNFSISHTDRALWLWGCAVG
uniref:Uncharacterized protein n=1 Tax=Sphaerodactylus townsendi TaxID=933632 RepID=A0ACB8GEK6_9SAUR